MLASVKNLTIIKLLILNLLVNNELHYLPQCKIEQLKSEAKQSRYKTLYIQYADRDTSL